MEDQWDAMGDVALGLSCLLKAAVMPQKLHVESEGQAKSMLAVGGKAAPSGSALRGLRQQVHSGLGTNPAWEARNLLRLKQERPQRDSAQPLVSLSLSFA